MWLFLQTTDRKMKIIGIHGKISDTTDSISVHFLAHTILKQITENLENH